MNIYFLGFKKMKLEVRVDFRSLLTFVFVFVCVYLYAHEKSRHIMIHDRK